MQRWLRNAEVAAEERFHAGVRLFGRTGVLLETAEVAAKCRRCCRGKRYHVGVRPSSGTGVLLETEKVAAKCRGCCRAGRYHAGVRPSGGTGVLLENGEAAIESTYGYRSKLFIGKGVVAKE